MNNLQVFKNEKLNLQMRVIQNDDGSISVNAEDTAIGFGWTKIETKSGKKYTSIRWDRMNGFILDMGFRPQVGEGDYIPESLFYLLGMKANNKVAQEFQKWLAIDVIPEIRKTGSYQAPHMSKELQSILMLDEKQQKFNDRLSKVENNMTIDYSQQEALRELGNKKVTAILGGSDAPAYKELGKKVFASFWRDYKRKLGVNSYKNTLVKDYEIGRQAIINWQPTKEVAFMIKGCNAQVRCDI